MSDPDVTAHEPTPDTPGGPPEDASGGADPDDQQPDTPTSGARPTSEDAPAPDDPQAATDAEPTEFPPEQLDALVAERDQYLDQLQRTHAEFDNFRKQSQKRLIDEVNRSQGAFVERLLPVLDAIEAAQAHGSTDIDAVAVQLLGFLEKEGLQRVSPTGEPFDPNVADAVMHEPADPEAETDEPIVTEVLRTGYLWNGRVIRAAMVKVAG